ncbi:MAG: hypothetical protein AUG51_04325 [Acidobacteria bacterium 13_1_20CM_3_53_8]|nr:MAG: hypothetical protein AUG51_04325 [Acidobacteria bacterium 13_1_20CM_3_53_8]
MKDYSTLLQVMIQFFKFSLVVFALFLFLGGARAQSSEIEYPTPVRSNEINGAIAPRDIGDARLTRHFYSFTGNNGDLTITVEYKNLDGTVDVFTTPDLRTMTNIRMLADVQATTTSKTFYLRQQESLILRVEARTPNDNEGTYRIRFAGAFAPVVGEVQTPEPITTASGHDPNARRVNSAGARIEEPRQESTAITTPTVPTAQPAETTANPASSEPAKPASASPSRTTSRTSRKPSSRNRSPRATRTQPPSTPPAERTSTENAPAASPTAPARPSTARRRTPARAARPQPEATPQPEPSTRLIIETRDGMRVERYMNTVRRVTVENGMVVIVMNDGTIQRQPLANILRMTIEP